MHIRQTIRYQNYKRFGSDVKITIGGVAPDKNEKEKKDEKKPAAEPKKE